MKGRSAWIHSDSVRYPNSTQRLPVSHRVGSVVVTDEREVIHSDDQEMTERGQFRLKKTQVVKPGKLFTIILSMMCLREAYQKLTRISFAGRDFDSNKKSTINKSEISRCARRLMHTMAVGTLYAVYSPAQKNPTPFPTISQLWRP